MKGKQSWIIGIQDGNQITRVILPGSGDQPAAPRHQVKTLQEDSTPRCQLAFPHCVLMLPPKQNKTVYPSYLELPICELLLLRNGSIHIWMLQHDVGNLPRDLSMED